MGREGGRRRREARCKREAASHQPVILAISSYPVSTRELEEREEGERETGKGTKGA